MILVLNLVINFNGLRKSPLFFGAFPRYRGLGLEMTSPRYSPLSSNMAGNPRLMGGLFHGGHQNMVAENMAPFHAKIIASSNDDLAFSDISTDVFSQP